jgi:hypothetical protein
MFIFFYTVRYLHYVLKVTNFTANYDVRNIYNTCIYCHWITYWSSVYQRTYIKCCGIVPLYSFNIVELY